MPQLLTLEPTSKLIKFPSAVSYHLGHKTGFENHEFDGSADFGMVSEDGCVGVLSKGCSLDVIYLDTNERLSAWTFTSQSDQEPEISCYLTFSEKPGARATHVIAGMNCGLDGGQLCVLDIASSKVTRCISLPYPVTSLALVSSCGGPSSAGYLHPALRYFHGIVSVGLTQGRLFLVDLALDETFCSSDSSPAGAVFVDPLSREVPRYRREALNRGNHVVIDLSCDLRGPVFVWEQAPTGPTSSPSSMKEVQFPADEVKITALHYSSFNASLAVGYNIGTWKLISLQSLQIDHSSNYLRNDKPVSHISFQEPENDPRNYVYYWIVRSDREEDTESLAVAAMYSLTYRNKQSELIGDEEMPLYTDLERLVLRFEHVLGGEEETNFSWCVGMYTLELAAGHVNHDSSDVEHSKDYALNVIFWKAGSSLTSAATYLGVFDINAWYQAQMPSTFSVDESDELCSYFSHSLLDDPNGQSGGILDLAVLRDSVTRFSGSGPILEQHCFPSSLTFDLVVVAREGYLTASHLGIQRRVLTELACRPSALVQPSQLYQICLMAGLAQGNMMEPSLLSQRELLLNIALEYNMVGLVVAAVRDWADGKYSKAGCTLKFIMDWAWKRVAAIKERLDIATTPLFDLTIREADDSCCQLLCQLSGQLAQLVSILAAVSAAAGVVTQVGLEQLECRQNVTGLVLLYTQAVGWFVNRGLLPEQPEGRSNPYPVRFLTDSYRERRRNMGKLTRSFGKPCLLVDLLCEDFGDDLIRCFQKCGGAGDYPPPSLHALLSVFLSDNPAPAKLRLVQYMFLDLAQILDQDEWGDLIDNLIKFPSAFSLPPSIIKLTQAFWLLDHEDWEESVAMMLDPLLQEDDLSPDHHRAILTALLAQGQDALALKYSRIRRPPILDQRDVQLQISVLLQNGAIQEAYTFQRSQQGSSGRPELLQQFYQRAEQLKKLDSVLKLSLSKAEEDQLVRFLQESKKPHSQDILLMYYLQRSRYTEAMQLNEKLKTLGGGQKAAARDAIMDRYCSILPSLNRGYVTLKKKGQAPPPPRPEPVNIVPTDMNMSLGSRARTLVQGLETPPQSLPSQTPFRKKGGRRRDIGLFAEEETYTGKRKLSDIPTLSFPTEVTAEETLNAPTNELVSPPSKRTRMSDLSSLSMSARGPNRIHSTLTGDALHILETPTIVRKSISRTREGSRDSINTPHSILKVKKLIQENSPSLEPAASPSDEFMTTNRSRETTPTKSLRFKVPKKLPPADTNVMPMPSGEAHTTIFSPSLVSPVAELATSSDREISFQVPAHRVDQDEFKRMKVRSVSESSKVSSEENESFHSVSGSPRDGLSPTLRTRLADVERKAKAVLQETMEDILTRETSIRCDDKEDVTETEVEKQPEPTDEVKKAPEAEDKSKINEEFKEEGIIEVIEDDDDEVASESSDEVYYNKNTIEKKTCDISVESMEDEGESPSKVEVSYLDLAPEDIVPRVEASETEKERDTENADWSKTLPWFCEDEGLEAKSSSPVVNLVVEDDPLPTQPTPVASTTFRFSTSSDAVDESFKVDFEHEPERSNMPSELLDFSEVINCSTEESEISDLPTASGPSTESVEQPPVNRTEGDGKSLDELLEDLDSEVSEPAVAKESDDFGTPVLLRSSSVYSYSYDTATCDVERNAGVKISDFLDFKDESFEIVTEAEVDAVRRDDEAEPVTVAEDRTDTDINEDASVVPVVNLESEKAESTASTEKLDRETESASSINKGDQESKEVEVKEKDSLEMVDGMREFLEKKAVNVSKADDEMRELLDCVSTTATRASSICGSLWSESQHETSLNLVEVIPEAAEDVGAETGEAADSENVGTETSTVGSSVDTVILSTEAKAVDEEEDMEVDVVEVETKEKEKDKQEPLLTFDAGPESETDEEESDSGGEEQVKLNFSWTNLAPAKPTVVENLTFSSPIQISKDQPRQSAEISTFLFAAPLDVSMKEREGERKTKDVENVGASDAGITETDSEKTVIVDVPAEKSEKIVTHPASEVGKIGEPASASENLVTPQDSETASEEIDIRSTSESSSKEVVTPATSKSASQEVENPPTEEIVQEIKDQEPGNLPDAEPDIEFSLSDSDEEAETTETRTVHEEIEETEIITHPDSGSSEGKSQPLPDSSDGESSHLEASATVEFAEKSSKVATKEKVVLRTRQSVEVEEHEIHAEKDALARGDEHSKILAKEQDEQLSTEDVPEEMEVEQDSPKSKPSTPEKRRLRSGDVSPRKSPRKTPTSENKEKTKVSPRKTPIQDSIEDKILTSPKSTKKSVEDGKKSPIESQISPRRSIKKDGSTKSKPSPKTPKKLESDKSPAPVGSTGKSAKKDQTDTQQTTSLQAESGLEGVTPDVVGPRRRGRPTTTPAAKRRQVSGSKSTRTDETPAQTDAATPPASKDEMSNELMIEPETTPKRNTRGTPAKPSASKGETSSTPSITPRRSTRSASTVEEDTGSLQRHKTTPKNLSETPVKVLQSPVITPAKSSRKSQLKTEETTPLTPTRRSRRISGPDHGETPLTPTRRSRRISGTEHGETPLTPTRRSRRISGAEPETEDNLGSSSRRSRKRSGVEVEAVTAPDGGVITGSGRKGTGTPRSARRHTSVKKEDVDVALGLTPTALAPVLEDAEMEEQEEEEAEIQPVKVKGGRGRRSTLGKISSLDSIQEEAAGGSQTITESAAQEKSKPRGRPKSANKTSSAIEQESSQTPEVGRRELRRRTIITLGQNEGLLFSPVEARAGDEQAEDTEKPKKKYVVRNKRKSYRL